MDVTTKKPLVIVGCGPGAADYMTEAGRNALAEAEAWAGAPHLLNLYAPEGRARIPIASDIEGALAAIAVYLGEGKRVAVLVSGDPGLCSLATPVIRRFGRAACEVIPGISSVQLAFARLGLDWLDARILSAHQSLPEVTPEELEACRCLAILCGHHQAREWVSGLSAAFTSDRRWIVCQDLSLPTEQIREVSGEAIKRMTLSSRTIILMLREEES